MKASAGGLFSLLPVQRKHLKSDTVFISSAVLALILFLKEAITYFKSIKYISI